MIFFCITLWRNAIVVTSVIVKELWKILLVLKTKTFCDLEEWTSFICLKVKHFQKKEKKMYTFSTHNGRGRGCTEGLFQKFTSDVMQFAAISGEILLQKSVLLRQVLTPSLLEVLLVLLLHYKFLVLLDRIWARYFCQKTKKAYIQFIFCS